MRHSECNCDWSSFVFSSDLFGMVFATPVLLSGTLTPLNVLLPRFLAINSTAVSVGLVNIPEFTLEARGIQVEVNQGTPWVGAALTQPHPVIDWQRSFPGGDPADVNANSDLDGFLVRTGTTTTPVVLDLAGTPLVGFSADRFLLGISDFVHVSGSLSVRLGPVLT